MDSSGVRRKVDDLGRVVIPSSIRKALGIRDGDELEVSVSDGRVVLAKPADRCTFCDAEEDLDVVLGKAVCFSCAGAIRALDRERAGESASPFGF